jgi:diguanylate cyclase (GGDEF)-like protein
MSERTTTLARSQPSRQDLARQREEPPMGARPNPELSRTELAVVKGDDLLHTEVLELNFRLEEAQQTIARLEEVIALLQERCTTDPLTRVYNRRGGEERLAGDVARASRGGGTLTLAVLDADKLKEVNDRWGHQAGDAYLRHLANAIERNIREGDWVARWGGDEFAVYFWDAHCRSAQTVLRRVSEDLRNNPPVRLARGEEVRVGFSARVCQHSGDGEDVSKLFSRADAALMAAKKKGRGAIVEAPSLRGIGPPGTGPLAARKDIPSVVPICVDPLEGGDDPPPFRRLPRTQRSVDAPQKDPLRRADY